MAAGTLEERVTALEAEVKRLKLQSARDSGAVSGRTAPDFLERFDGIFKDDPHFDNVVCFSEERRERERLEAEQEADRENDLPA